MQAMKTVAEMSVEELKELIRQVIAEQREYFLDEEGWLVFTSEEAYTRYLERHPDKMPSELKACFIDENGVKLVAKGTHLGGEVVAPLSSGFGRVMIITNFCSISKPKSWLGLRA